MLVGEIVLDLAGLAHWFKPILTVVLLTIGIVFFVVPWLKEVSSKITPMPQPSPAPLPKIRSSDAPAPAGIGEFLKTIEITAPNANPEIWWGYAKAEMTEAQVAIAEAKLARRNDNAPDPVKPDEVKN